MPSLGADMEDGTLVRWEVAPGAQVRRGQALAQVETEKGIIDIESFEDGVVEKLVVEPGARVPVGTTLALFAGEPAAAVPVAAPQAAPPPAGALTTPVPPAAAPAGGYRGVRISPAARARAAELGVDIGSIGGPRPRRG